MAAAIMATAGSVPAALLAGTVFLGELGLDGRLRPVPGVLPSAASAAGFGRAVVPPENAAEATLVPGVQVVSSPSLSALVHWLCGDQDSAAAAGVRIAEPSSGIPPPGTSVPAHTGQIDLADVVGQPVARRAAEICAAGGHHMLLLGPPGTGKPMPELKSV